MVEYVNEEFLTKRFENGVDVIGNARSLQLKNYGDIIDSKHTIRFNWPELNQHTGTRLDTFVCSLPEHIPSNYQFELLISRNKTAHNNNKYQYVVPDSIKTNSQRDVNSATDNKKPSNGFLLLYLLDVLKVTDVSIFGFDWKDTPSSTIKPNKKVITKQNDHDYESEKKLLLQMIEKNDWSLFT